MDGTQASRGHAARTAVRPGKRGASVIRTLVIETESLLRQELESILRRRGHLVVGDRDPEGADLIVLGPGAGEEGRRVVRGRNADGWPVVAALVRDAAAGHDALAAGADEVILAPFQAEGIALRLPSLERTLAARSEQARMAQALRESDERYQALLELSPDGVVVHRDGRIVFANPQAAAIVGAEHPERLHGVDILDLIHPDERHRAVQRRMDVERRGRPLPFERRTIVRLDGTPAVVEIGAIPLPFQGQPAIQSVVRDPTERQAAERALRESEERHRTLLEMSPDGIVVHVDGLVVYANAAACRIMGTDDPDHLLGRPVLDWVHPRHRAVVRSRIERALATGASLPAVELELVRIDAVPVMVETRSTRLAWGGTDAVLVAFRDVSERHRMAEERERMARQLQETQKLESLGVLAGGIAHDFNNLLTGVLGNAALLRETMPADKQARASLQAIERSAERAADLCRELLAYAGKGRVAMEPVDLSALVAETIHLLEHAMDKGATFEVSLARGLPPVMADETQIRQIVMNLVMNASDALEGRKGAITVSTGRLHATRELLAHSILGQELREGPYVVLEVADTGIGMSRETLGRIFEPFFTTKFTGRGLGLAAVLGIVRGHGGALDVRSAPGEGSRFRLLLPRAPGFATGEMPAVRAPAAEWSASGTVLVVDDEPVVRKLAARVLQTAGLTVLTADGGDEALRLFAGDPSAIDAVIVDLTMPAPDGAETVRRLRAERPDLPLVMMSGYTEDDVTPRLAGQGARFLQKPFTPDALRDAIRDVLRRS